MALKSLLAFCDAPDFHAIQRKIFHEERSFRISPSKPVKHKDKKDVELSQLGILLDLLKHLAILYRCLKTGNFLFIKFLDNPPLVCCRKLPTRLPLHGDIILSKLLDGGYAVKAINLFPL